MRIFSALLITSTLLSVSNAFACPTNLATSRIRVTASLTLCQAYDRYASALQHLQAEGISEPRRIGNLMAPRFINLPDWNAKRTIAPTSATSIYAPAPVTWVDWEAGAQIIDERARKNLGSHSFTPLVIDDLLRLHRSALKDVLVDAGHLRKSLEVGRMISKASSMTESQVQGVLSLPYLNATTAGKLVAYKPVDCLQDQSAEFQKRFSDDYTAGRLMNIRAWSEIDSRKFYDDGKGQKRQCGFIQYAAVEEVQPQLDRWLETVNSATQSWNANGISGDPIALAAMAQQWLVSIHPFTDGNGRTSRFAMDLILESLGLPAPVLAEMNDDLYSTPQQWRAAVGNGIERAVFAAESCARAKSGLGCAEIKSGAAR